MDYILSKKLVYDKNGPLLDVIRVEEENMPCATLAPGKVLIKMIYAPIHPSDIFRIEGTYPSRGPVIFPATGGLEGVGLVKKTNSEHFAEDDVVMVRIGWGTWRQYGIADEKELTKLPKDANLDFAANIIGVQCTAYILLKHCGVPLTEGDVIIQNAANSAVGQAIIQLAPLFGLKTINVIRNRHNVQEAINHLKNLGADHVVTEDQLRTGLTLSEIGLSAPKMGIDNVGGVQSADLVRTIANNGVLMVFGKMSGEPVQFPQNDLWFRGIKMDWFSSYVWMVRNPTELIEITHKVLELNKEGKLKANNYRKYPIEQWKDAVRASTEGFSNSNEKVLLQFNLD